MKRALVAVAAAALLAQSAAAAQGATLVGTQIENVAELSYEFAGESRHAASNRVLLRVEPEPSRALATLARFTTSAADGGGDPAFESTTGPTLCVASGVVSLLGPPAGPGGRELDPQRSAPLARATSLHAGETIVLRVEDADQNRDARALDTIDVQVRSSESGDLERLRLTESALDSGVFVGYIASTSAVASAGNCRLELQRDSTLELLYADPRDPADLARATALVDPTGLVFDATTGQPVDGARVRLVEATSGRPASVRGDDGTSAYPSELITGEAVTDAGGTVYRLPAGRFRFPLVAPGTYRLIVEPPRGRLFPSDALESELQRLPGAPFRIGDGSFGRPFAVSGPVPTRVDVPVDPAGETLQLRKSASTERAAIGDVLQYELQVENASRSGSIRGIRIVDRLPAGLRLRSGSLYIGEQGPLEPELAADGREFAVRVPLLTAGQSARIRYVVEVTPAARARELVNEAEASAEGGLRSPIARTRLQLEDELFRREGFVLGRVVDGACGAPGVHPIEPGVEGVRIYLETGRYAITDRDGRYHFEGVPSGTHVLQIDPETVPEGHEVVACDPSVRNAGRAYSQFVELRPGGLWRADFRIAPRATAGSASLIASGPLAASAPTAQATVTAAGPVEPAVPADAEGLEPGPRFIAPAENANPAIASIKVAIAHDPATRVVLHVNGEVASELNFDGVVRNAAGTVALSRWRGLDLRDGANELRASLVDASGNEVASLVRAIHYGGGAVRGELDRASSRLVADGRTAPIIALRLFDAYGKPARPGTLGSFRVSAPYRTRAEVDALDDNPLLTSGTREPTYTVGPDGIARLELEPTTQTGTAVLTLRFNERQTQEVRVWLEPSARDWVLVGLATGTASWRELSGRIEPAGPEDAPTEEGFDTSGRIALFAKGRIRGDYLLTLAYDSARDPSEARARARGTIEPDRYYLLYGDGTEPREEAASGERVFVKLERRQFYALFGDYDSGLTVTELARYSRSLTGFKTEYAGERVGLTAFAARTDLGFGRDELRGDGTSGPYRLSRRSIVIGSDKLRIEVRDRFRTERVVSVRELTRFIDYVIDYASGAVLLEEPLASRDEGLDLNYLIAEYETRGAGEETTAAGARGAVRFADGTVELGASLVHDGTLQGDTRLAGADLEWRIDPVTTLRAEIAGSESKDPLRAESALAWLTELERVSERLELRASARQQDNGFGVGQQLASESGTRKYGAEARWRVGERWALDGELLRQEALETSTRRTLAASELHFLGEGANLNAGLRHVRDESPQDPDHVSNQLTFGGSIDLLERRLTLRANAEAALGGEDESVDYPSRLLLGADWKLRDWATLYSEWEAADGAALHADTARIGIRAEPWEQTRLTTALNRGRDGSEFGPRVYASIGIAQGFRLDEHWTLDLGLDRTSTLDGIVGLEPVPTATTPLASGSIGEDFTAGFFGARYHAGDWTMTGRIERRVADTESRWVTSAGWYREPIAGHALSLTLQSLASDAAGETPDLDSADLRFAWAWRPEDRAWIILNRSELVREATRATLSRLESLRWVNNLHLNWQVDPDTQAGLQLGWRHVIGTFDGRRFPAGSVLLGGDWRRDLPWRLYGRPIDLGSHLAWLYAPRSRVSQLQYGLDFGIAITTNAWIAFGWNFEGFDDEDFGATRQTARGPYISVRIKLDQDSFRDLRLDSLDPPR